MDGYDRGWRPRYDRDFRARGYPHGRGTRNDREWGMPFGAGGYAARDLDMYGPGAYGPDYPGYGGYPDSGRRGIHYGGHDEAYPRRPFVPEEAYEQHPRMREPPRHGGGRWPGEWGRDEMPQEMSDREVYEAVRQNLYGDTWIDPERIEVHVEQGVVTLTGEVDDYMEARYAWDDAWESPGVRGVLNQLTVRMRSESEGGDPLVQTE